MLFVNVEQARAEDAMKNSHCYENLTPVTFLERSGRYFPDGCAIRLQDRIVCFGELLESARKMASVLQGLGVKYGDRVGLLACNSLQSIEAHYAIPGIGGVIVSLNPWLPGNELVKQIEYSEACVILVSGALFRQHVEFLSRLSRTRTMVVLDDWSVACNLGTECVDYQSLFRQYDSGVILGENIRSENDPIVINFTSGTTGNPKGVMYSHRAGYLHALGQALMLNLSRSSIYYWSLPMFHVNGWGHMWAAVSVGAVQVVDESVNDSNYCGLAERVRMTGATHLAGAPRLVRLLSDEAGDEPGLEGLTVMTGGAAPTPDLIKSMSSLGVNLIHQYGLNETCGPFVVCETREEWRRTSPDEQVEKRLRQGVPALHAGVGVRVVDQHMVDVPWDGMSYGEVIMSGNTVAQGYYKNPAATDQAFKNGWFYSGDMAVVHPDGYLEIKDRVKDLIFVETSYGWENISSIEIENLISQFPDIRDVAVLGVSNAGEGAVIVAFYETEKGRVVESELLLEFCRKALPYYKVPKHAFEITLPKTATGKVRKNELGAEARNRLLADDWCGESDRDKKVRKGVDLNRPVY